MSSLLRILADVADVTKLEEIIGLVRYLAIAAFIVAALVGAVALVAFLIDCLKKAGTAIPSYVGMATNEPENFPLLPLTQILLQPPPGHRPEMLSKIRTLERFTSKQLEDYTDKRSNPLGSGGYGKVYKGELPNKTPVAVKMLMNAHDKETEEQFMEEVSTIGRIQHINLIRLHGYCYAPNTRALVYEYMENGSLDKFLSGDKMPIDWPKRHEIAVGTAKGIAYLHKECGQTIVHYDIKPGNILLDQNYSPKVADFGLAKHYNRESGHISLSGFRGTHGYAAPEIGKPHVTYKCDVYSFGIVLFEIVGRRNPNENLSQWPRQCLTMLKNSKLLSMLCVWGVPGSESEKAVRMVKVALLCIHYKPDMRPEMGRVVKMLEGEIEIPEPEYPFEDTNPDQPSQDSGNGSEGDSGSSL